MKALIAMSGGVDSSVAAKITKDLGYECIGCTMKLYDNADAGIPKGHTCCSLSDVEDARNVAFKLNIPYYVFNFKDGFREKVIDKFIKSYENGKTPNPCIDCNKYMKFEKLFERAHILGCDYIVTGHYAKIEKCGKEYLLKKAVDETKDQSYVLYDLTQEQLAHMLFPLGGMKKSQTREIALQSGFINAKKHDSQDICFVPDGNYADFIKRNSDKQYKEGNFIDKNGKVLGRHKGIIHYTIGQRKGLGLSLPEPAYVCRIDTETNSVILGNNNDLYSYEVKAQDFNWISGEVPDSKFRCKAKIRYRQPEQWATVTAVGKYAANIVFDEAQRAVTPGQSAVLYDGDIVLGGGIIC